MVKIRSLPKDFDSKIARRLSFIYKEKFSETLVNRILELIIEAKQNSNKKKEKWDEKDIILITYGNSLVEFGKPHLHTLHQFLSSELKKRFTYVHILPFFPYSTDDGFSVIDYYKVHHELGNWDDIEKIGKNVKLMFDLVINHVSRKSEWFENFLKDKDPGKDYFIEVDPDTDLSHVVRPRSSSLLTGFSTDLGKKYVWTTFSSDQIDLNFSNPVVLIEMIKILLFYIKKGAQIIRFDAIAFLWKEIGTSCIHLPETHEFVKLFRDILEVVDPALILLTETNVPNKENLSYFGNGDETNMVYQFSLPPLLLHTLHTGNSEYLTEWASKTPETEPGNTFLNFTASHDGIGIRPLEGLLPKEELDKLLQNMKLFGGQISYKKNSDGSESPYEINITYFDALKGNSEGIDEFQIERFLCSQIIMMTLKGIPAFYIHSLLASSNYYEGVEKTGRARTINREKLNYHDLIRELQGDNVRARVFHELKRIIDIRKSIQAFHPSSAQKILNYGQSIFAFKRANHNQTLLSISNITNQSQVINLNKEFTDKKPFDSISRNKLTIELILNPYQTVWLD